MITFGSIIGTQPPGTIVPGYVSSSIIASGGIEVSGTAALNNFIVATGGVNTSGFGVCYQRNLPNSSFSNTKNVAIPDLNLPLQIDGIASITSTSFKYVSSGGLDLTSIAQTTYNTNFVVLPIGGAQLGSNNLIRQQFLYTYISSLEISSSAIVKNGINYVAIPTSKTISGSAILSYNINAYNVLATGGISTGDQASYLFNINYNTNSNILTGGSSTYSQGWVYSSIGNIDAGGSFIYKIIDFKWVAVTSKITLKSNAIIKLLLNEYNYVSNINAILSGKALVEASFNNLICDDQIGCLVELSDGKKYRDCFNGIYLTPNVKIFPNTADAFLPAVTICRQNYQIPTPNNNRKKIWSSKK